MIQYLDKAVPNQGCLVTQRSDLPVVDFGVYAQGLDPRLVISVPVITEAAEALGFVRAESYGLLREENERLQERIDQLEAEASEFDSVIQAIDVIESHDHFRRAKRKPGKTKVEKPQEVAA